MTENYYAVIMAGGGGTRLWPLSRQDRPKQMLSLVDEYTLFQTSVNRLKDLFPPERIFVVTSAPMAVQFQAQSPEIPAENYIIEPAPRDTAAAVALSSVAIKAHDPNGVMAVVTADHFIEHEDRFLKVLQAAQAAAEQGYLVTLGIQPSFPATGFGYIQQGNYLGNFEGIDAFHALSFKEKPDKATAEQFLETEDHSWNSGMFIWRVDDVLAEFERQMPKLYAAVSEVLDVWHTPERSAVLERVWQDLEKVSVDYGIMEQAEKVAVIPARGLGWSDVGSWNALFDVLPADAAGNIVKAEEYLNLNSSGTLIHANGGQQRMIVTIGVQDLVIVDTEDVLLVCNKEQAQDVRQIVNLLKEQGKKKHL